MDLLVERYKAFSIKEVDKKRRRTVGILSTGKPDRDGEMVDQEALQKLMPSFIENNGILLFMHAWRAGGVGKVVDWAPGEDQTLITCEYSTGHEIVYDGVLYNTDNVWKQVEQGILRTHSFGFLAKREDMRNGFYKLIPTDILEATVATIPANPGAVFEVAKFFDGSRAKPKIEDPDNARVMLALMNLRIEQGMKMRSVGSGTAVH